MHTHNHLSRETSPYLQQHANNPVDWYPWGPEALDKAKREDKPILLSIGYSACHWCHVMAHESFEDLETADLMNRLFVNIKIDREERPDLDKIYQLSHQMLTGRGGGWPLTVFLTPDQMPFFVGTYFPKESLHQLPAFKDLLLYMSDIYHNRKTDIQQQNQTLMSALQRMTPAKPAIAITLNSLPLIKGRDEINLDYDSVHGGFGGAPKFPHPVYLILLLNAWFDTNKQDEVALTMLQQTLTKMAQGGIYDQIGGGFYRYTVDAAWQIPHFEKMLYDNGQLLAMYAQVFSFTKNQLFKNVAQDTAKWVMRDMQSAEGGYYSSMDADSEGHEGKFYLWTSEYVKTLLTVEEYDVLKLHSNLMHAANFEGQWHLSILHNLDEVARMTQRSRVEVESLFLSARSKLLYIREQRVRPGRDEKILTSWNGLMIKGMVLAGVHLQRPDFIASAERALKFIYQTLWRKGRLLATYKDGRAHLSAYLDDYAFLLEGILTYLQARWDSSYFQFAQELAEVLLTHFQDLDQGGFFFIADDHEKLIYRPKNLMDEATPAGNGIAMFMLQRLGYLLGETRYLHAAEKALQMVWPDVEKYPSVHGSTLLTLQEYLTPPEIIIICGNETDILEWQKITNESYSPHRLVFAIPKNATNLPPPLAEKLVDKATVAYFCQGQKCSSPVYKLQEFENAVRHIE